MLLPQSEWNGLRDEAVAHLSRLIQIDTTNPPGNEMVLARYLDETLHAAGIETHLYEPVSGRAAIVARLRAEPPAAPPVLLLAHMDVVGVEREAWTQDPFGGAVIDGYVYGRGAIDDKGMLAVNLVSLLLMRRLLSRGRHALTRDVVLVATSDEEAGGTIGTEWLIDQHPELMRAEFALNEGGRIRVVDGKPLYAAIQCAEKVSNVVTVIAVGPGGHASVPLPRNPVARLARAIALIAEHREPVTLLPTTREFFAGLATVWPHPGEAAAMADLSSDNALRRERGATVLSATPLFDAVLRSGISPTILDAGLRHNVIPTEARATLSVRTLPGESIDAVVQRLNQLVNDPAVEIEITHRGLDAPASPSNSAAFAALRDSLHDIEPSIAAVPYLSTGATESAFLRRWGVPTYGILPFPLSPDDEGRMHGHDERVPINAVGFALQLVTGFVARLAIKPC
ncbi:MAG TPA: M20/M25/M40 family metallo-hydrolase [Gemmatimonadaceae bacterium]|jgi:acetylornithine deacetylase/succinyl-diaminopimelate desuccinylase-like protein|nr:M20/M25/M40 family metallo-hydrolase [Gemmatimonadaceae bacterium]